MSESAAQAPSLLQAHRAVFSELTSQVAACVDQDELQAAPWAAAADAKRQARFVSYALSAAAEALQAANWHPRSAADKAMTGVAIGVGMSSTQDIADAGVLVSQVPHLAEGLECCCMLCMDPKHANSRSCPVIADGLQAWPKGQASAGHFACCCEFDHRTQAQWSLATVTSKYGFPALVSLVLVIALLVAANAGRETQLMLQSSSFVAYGHPTSIQQHLA